MARPQLIFVSLLLASCINLIANANGRRVRHEISTPSTTEARIVFPGRTHSKVEDRPKWSSGSFNESLNEEIPVSIFLNSHITNTDEFINELLINKEDFQSAIPNVNISGNASIYLRANTGARTSDLATMAFCSPQLTTVELEKSNDPAVIYYPTCTRVERCGGCCVHGLLSCEPTKIEIMKVKVIINRYKPGRDGFYGEGFKLLDLEKHIACNCNCRIKVEDCNALQDYKANECKCVCRNQHEIESCTGENRFWDPRSCSCHCRNVIECSTGFFYDTNTCSCKPVAAVASRLPTGLNFQQWKSPTYDVTWENARRRSTRGRQT